MCDFLHVDLEFLSLGHDGFELGLGEETFVEKGEGVLEKGFEGKLDFVGGDGHLICLLSWKVWIFIYLLILIFDI